MTLGLAHTADTVGRRFAVATLGRRRRRALASAGEVVPTVPIGLRR